MQNGQLRSPAAPQVEFKASDIVRLVNEISEKAAAVAFGQMTDQMAKLNWSQMDTPEKVFTQSETLGQCFHVYNQLEVDAGDWEHVIQRVADMKWPGQRCQEMIEKSRMTATEYSSELNAT